MKTYAANLTACVILVFLCAGFQSTFAAKLHWQPGNTKLYHQFIFHTRKKQDVSDRIDYQGWNYAGRGEFPWLVEIRGNNTEDFDGQEDWSNGNLVSSRFVLTVCYAVVNVKSYDSSPFARTDPLFNIGENVDQTYFSPKNPKYYKVLYSDDYTYKSVGNGYYTGTRQVRRFIPHPKCNQFELDFQWGVVEIKRPIWPVPPWTSYMPIDFNPNGFNDMKKQYVFTRADLTQAARCSVGLWSRRVSAEFQETVKGKVEKSEFTNDKLWNYKIKYSVFNADPLNCWNQPGINVFPRRVRVGAPLEEWECMATNFNETLGNICDHDRGAPIVCDGVVRAIVLTGKSELKTLEVTGFIAKLLEGKSKSWSILEVISGEAEPSQLSNS